MIDAGFSRRQLQQIRDWLRWDDLTDRGVININSHDRENPRLSRLVGELGSGNEAEWEN
jgi:hypothetical protein